MHEPFTTKLMSENLILALLVEQNLETESKFHFIVGTHNTLINKKEFVDVQKMCGANIRILKPLTSPTIISLESSYSE